jgi:hypothetical protein
VRQLNFGINMPSTVVISACGTYTTSLVLLCENSYKNEG